MMDQIKGDTDEKEAATRMVLNSIQWRHFQIAEQIFQAWKKKNHFSQTEVCSVFKCYGLTLFLMTFLHILGFRLFY